MVYVPIHLGVLKANRHVPPLYAALQVNLGFWLFPAVVILTLFLLFLDNLINHPKVSTATFLAISISLFLLIGISVAMIDGYKMIDGQWLPAFFEPYNRLSLEYYGDVPLLDEVGFYHFLKNYSKPDIFQNLSGHTQTHPPGGVIFLWVCSKIFGYNLISASLISILFTSISIIPIYLLAKELYSEQVGKLSIILFLVMPNFVIFTSTSMDGPFSVFPILSIYLFFKSISVPKKRIAICLGLCLSFGMLMTYSTTVIGLYFIVFVFLSFIFNRQQFHSLIKILSISLFFFATFYIFLFLATNFDPFGALWASIKKDEAGMGTGYETVGRYLNLSIANLSAFLIGVGVPLTILWFNGTVKSIQLSRDLFPFSYLVTLVIITFSTLYTMEVERIWIFMAPFIVIPAAKYLHSRNNISDLRWIISLMVLQLLLFEVMLYTYW